MTRRKQAASIWGFETRLESPHEGHRNIVVTSSAWMDEDRVVGRNPTTGEPLVSQGRQWSGVTEAEILEAQGWAAGIIARLALRGSDAIQASFLDGRSCDCGGECGIWWSSEYYGAIRWCDASDPPTITFCVPANVAKRFAEWLGVVLAALVDPSADEPPAFRLEARQP